MKFVMIGLVAVAFAPVAFAQETCTAPPAPAPYNAQPMPPEPAPPACVDLASKVSKCTQKEADAYNAQNSAYVQAYNQRITEMNAYTGQLNAYITGSGAYAKCEQTRIQSLKPATAPQINVVGAAKVVNKRDKRVNTDDDNN